MVVGHEPNMALFGGVDGLDFYRAIIKNYKDSLKDDGMIAFEVGINEYNGARNVQLLLKAYEP